MIKFIDVGILQNFCRIPIIFHSLFCIFRKIPTTLIGATKAACMQAISGCKIEPISCMSANSNPCMQPLVTAMRDVSILRNAKSRSARRDRQSLLDATASAVTATATAEIGQDRPSPLDHILPTDRHRCHRDRTRLAVTAETAATTAPTALCCQSACYYPSITTTLTVLLQFHDLQ